MGYHGIVWGSMGITRNAMENLGFLPFCCMAEKTNINESNQLQADVKVMHDRAFLSPWAPNQEFP